ncbi:MAG: cache domain-containing protein [Pseudomonadota bacterium]
MRHKLSLIPLLALFFSLAFLTSTALAAKPAPNPAQEKAIKAMVASAAKLIKTKGDAALAEFNANAGNRWGKGPTGIFVSDEKGLELANAAEPGMVGKSVWDYKDPDGKLVVQEEIKLAKTKGKGWLDCKWAKPGTDQPVACRAFVQGVKVKGKFYLVGAAYYPQ